MTFYADKAATASRLLAKYGQTATVVRTDVRGNSPAFPHDGFTTLTRFPARVAVFEVSEDRVDGTNILAGDIQVICEATGPEITAEDRIECSAGTLTIKRLGKIAPAGQTVAYDMVCTK